MWPNRENADEEPEWVKNERKQFVNYRDKSKDGKLDKTEVKDWLLPENFDHAKAEAKHLIYETDDDKVCTLLHRRACFFYVLQITVAFLFLGMPSLSFCHCFLGSCLFKKRKNNPCLFYLFSFLGGGCVCVC